MLLLLSVASAHRGDYTVGKDAVFNSLSLSLSFSLSLTLSLSLSLSRTHAFVHMHAGRRR